MIHCISCEKFPKDLRQVPYNFVGSADTFKVKLLSDTTPVTFPVDGSGVAELSDDVKFAFGSILYTLD